MLIKPFHFVCAYKTIPFYMDPMRLWLWNLSTLWILWDNNYETFLFYETLKLFNSMDFMKLKFSGSFHGTIHETKQTKCINVTDLLCYVLCELHTHTHACTQTHIRMHARTHTHTLWCIHTDALTSYLYPYTVHMHQGM